MERIFSNLYRFKHGPYGLARGWAHTYLLVRKKGNILICHCQRGSTVTDHFDEIEKLGGIERQFVNHYHDAKRGDLHQEIYDHFGCEISYHSAERSALRAKTKCPEIEFGDEGLQLGMDFEAHYFPGHTMGMSVYRWRSRGRYLLFPSHVMKLGEKEWGISFNPHLTPHLMSQHRKLVNLDVDFVFPNGANDTEADYHRFDDRSRKLFKQALRRTLRPRSKEPEKIIRSKVVTNGVTHHVSRFVVDTGMFEMEKMQNRGNCKISLLMTYLQSAEVLISQDWNRKLSPDHAFVEGLRDFVNQGGGLLISASRPPDDPTWLAAVHPFPEIATHASATRQDDTSLVLQKSHPATKSFRKGTELTSTASEGGAFVPGPEGNVLIRNASGDAVFVVARIGKGRVIFTSLRFGRDKVFPDTDQQLLADALRWLARR